MSRNLEKCLEISTNDEKCWVLSNFVLKFLLGSPPNVVGKLLTRFSFPGPKNIFSQRTPERVINLISGVLEYLKTQKSVFAAINFRDFAIFFGVRESLYPRNRLFSATRESLYPRNLTFEVTLEILIKKYKKWSKFTWKSENLAEIFLDRESLYQLNFWMGPFAKVYTS